SYLKRIQQNELRGSRSSQDIHPSYNPVSVDNKSSQAQVNQVVDRIEGILQFANTSKENKIESDLLPKNRDKQIFAIHLVGEEEIIKFFGNIQYLFFLSTKYSDITSANDLLRISSEIIPKHIQFKFPDQNTQFSLLELEYYYYKVIFPSLYNQILTHAKADGVSYRTLSSLEKKYKILTRKLLKIEKKLPYLDLDSIVAAIDATPNYQIFLQIYNRSFETQLNYVLKKVSKSELRMQETYLKIAQMYYQLLFEPPKTNNYVNDGLILDLFVAASTVGFTMGKLSFEGINLPDDFLYTFIILTEIFLTPFQHIQRAWYEIANKDRNFYNNLQDVIKQQNNEKLNPGDWFYIGQNSQIYQDTLETWNSLDEPMEAIYDEELYRQTPIYRSFLERLIFQNWGPRTNQNI
ncbi:MAG: hypothetical protein KDD40_12665, partial [Bdellovibrionales bacterium]|nr:hypothetical protein [Bdellovibrionales bacterium]